MRIIAGDSWEDSALFAQPAFTLFLLKAVYIVVKPYVI